MKIIQDRDHLRIPEWLCILLYTVATAALSFALFMYSMPKEKIIRYAKEKPTVYVVARNQYANLDGSTIYSLEYTIDGEMQIPANFRTEKEMIHFEQYLYRAARRVE